MSLLCFPPNLGCSFLCSLFPLLNYCSISSYARHSIAATMQFAVACGLPYEPYGPTASTVAPSVMLPSPSNENDLLDRRNLWCGIAMLDSTIPFASGIQSTAPSEVNISTAVPSSMGAHQSPSSANRVKRSIYSKPDICAPYSN